MTATKQSKSAAVRAKLRHPVVDADGHLIELTPVLMDYVKQVGGAEVAARVYSAIFDPALRTLSAPLKQRHDKWQPMLTWWGWPSGNTLDRMTVSLPRLLHERLPEMGLDYAVLYPSGGLLFDSVFTFRDDEARAAAFRGANMYLAEQFGDRAFADRMTPVAVIPMSTPQAAVDELEHSVNRLGFKAVMLVGYARRKTSVVREDQQSGFTGHSDRLDLFGIDSEYDYDPVWKKCAELKVMPVFHSQGYGWGARRSTSNFVYNHIGHFAAAGEALCKALFLGGVTRRFPELRFCFLEGGVGWAANLYADLVGHWGYRNPEALKRHSDPKNLDVELMSELTSKYGAGRVLDRLEELTDSYRKARDSGAARPEELDDYSRCGIQDASDIKTLFAERFYFGCEADDPMNALAFDARSKPFGAKLNAMLGSDIGHMDVTDITAVLAEAIEPVEEGLWTEAEFRRFVFSNAVSFYAHLNRDFFKGTSVEAAAREELGAVG